MGFDPRNSNIEDAGSLCVDDWPGSGHGVSKTHVAILSDRDAYALAAVKLAIGAIAACIIGTIRQTSTMKDVMAHAVSSPAVVK
jgi:hypothetical protein